MAANKPPFTIFFYLGYRCKVHFFIRYMPHDNYDVLLDSYQIYNVMMHNRCITKDDKVFIINVLKNDKIVCSATNHVLFDEVTYKNSDISTIFSELVQHHLTVPNSEKNVLISYDGNGFVMGYSKYVCPFMEAHKNPEYVLPVDNIQYTVTTKRFPYLIN